jgi:uncharacterized protein (UPF0333 family)
MIFSLIVLTLVIVLLFYCCTDTSKCSQKTEHYRDNIWLNKKKYQDDYYPRSTGSVYGTPRQPWDMMSGVAFTNAY